MFEPERRAFQELLQDCFAAYGKTLPEVIFLKVWWSKLSPYPLEVVRVAFENYQAKESNFVPTPIAIANNCKLMDGRPNNEEAWAMSLKSMDEGETVVWTEEMQNAFFLAYPVIKSSGAISARKTFIEVYDRLVLNARSEQKAAVWSVTVGADKDRQRIVVEAAYRQGLLTGEVAKEFNALPAPEKNLAIGYDYEAQEDRNRQSLRRLYEVMATLEPSDVKAERIRVERLERDRAATESAKSKIREDVEEKKWKLKNVKHAGQIAVG